MAPMTARRRRTGRPFSTAADRRPDAVPLQAYLNLVRRHLVVVLLLGGLGLGVGLVAAARQAPIWASGATVLAPAIAMDPQAPPDKPVRRRHAVSLDSEAAVIMSQSVLQRAVTGTPVTTAQLAARTTVTAVPNSRVLRVQVRDSSEARAQLLTANLAAAYLDTRRQLLTDRRRQQSESLRRQLAALQAPSKVAAQAYAKLKQADAGNGIHSIGGPQGVLGSVTDVNEQIHQLRQNLIDLEDAPVVAGELLRSATQARRLRGQPEVPVISWLLVGLIAAGVVVAVRERRPPAPASVADVVRLPLGHALPVGVLDEDGPVHDSSAGWVRMADAIGIRPAAVMVVPVDTTSPVTAVGRLSGMLRRRGYTVAELLDFDHGSPGPGGATTTMRRVRESGQHVICEGPPLDRFGAGLSATEADAVVLIMKAGAVPHARLAAGLDELSRLGLPVVGVILDREGRRR